MSLAGGQGGKCVSAGCSRTGGPLSPTGSGRGALLHNQYRPTLKQLQQRRNLRDCATPL